MNGEDEDMILENQLSPNQQPQNQQDRQQKPIALESPGGDELFAVRLSQDSLFISDLTPCPRDLWPKSPVFKSEWQGGFDLWTAQRVIEHVIRCFVKRAISLRLEQQKYAMHWLGGANLQSIIQSRVGFQQMTEKFSSVSVSFCTWVTQQA